MVYRRGITVSISYDPEREKAGNHLLYTPEDGRGFSNPLRPPFIATLINGNDTLNYFPATKAGILRHKPGLASPRHGVQLRLEKKLRSGFEFGGGLYYSKGYYDTAPATAPTTELTDFAYYAGRINYLTYGLTGQLKFDFFRNHRLQPSIGLRSLFLNQQTRLSNFRAVFPAYGTEAFVNPTAPAARTEPVNSFLLELRVTFTLTYALTERILLAANTHLLSANGNGIGGLQVKYRLTDY
jgi:hypothetical protein